MINLSADELVGVLRHRLGVEVDTLTLNTDAWTSLVYRLNKHFIVKVSKDSDGANKIWKEGCLLPYLRSRLGDIVPNVAANFNAKIGGVNRAILVYEEIRGEAPTRPSIKRRWEEAEPCGQLAKTLGLIHGLSVPKDCAHLVPQHGDAASWASWIKWETSRLLGMCGNILGAHLSQRVLTACRGYTDWLVDTGLRPTFIHGDVDPRNIIVDPHGSTRGLIDWGEAAVGDPALDYAGLYFSDHVGPHVLALQAEEDPAALEPRIVFHDTMVPLYWAAYGSLRGETKLVRTAVRQLEARLTLWEKKWSA
jgi:Ser/Thr protein kinase RdoA (MazF antagonist)